jgi:hypothetical protein
MRSAFCFVLLGAVGSLAGSPTLLAASSDFCALSVKVSDGDGKPINSTRIELVDSTGQIELRQTVGPDFQICDFKFGPHTLRLGVNECFPVAVSNLEVRLGSPIALDLRLPKCAYGRPMYGSSTGERACSWYFRTITQNGEPLSEVEISPNVGPGIPRTDSYGRRQGIMAGTKEVTFSKLGYESKTLRVGCPESGLLEVSVPLAPRR